MKASSFLVGLCISTSWLLAAGLTVRTNRTTANRSKSGDAQSSAIDLRNDRNRRLIPYTPYYISENPNHSNSIQNNPTAAGEEINVVAQQAIRPLVTTKKPPQYVYTEEFQQEPNNRFSYIPIAYIPGVRGGVNYQPDSHYYHQQEQSSSSSLNKNPILVDDGANKPFSSASPSFYTTAQSATGDKKLPFAYYGDYITQPGSAGGGSAGNFLSHLNAPLVNTKTVLQGTYVAPTPKTPILFSTPQNDYLDFRYSEVYKTTPAPKYEVTATPPAVVEITSPKHYTVGGNAAAFATATTPNPPSNRHVTPPSVYQQLPFDDYPEVAHFAYSPPIVPPSSSRIKLQQPQFYTQIVASTPATELATQPTTKTQMTIVKSHEIRYPTGRPSASPADYDHIQYVSRPYVNAAAAATAQDFTVDDLFNGYNINKQLPERITPDNLKDSIKTLSYILQILQKADSITQFERHPNDYADSILETLKDAAPSLTASDEHKAVNSLQSVDPAYDTYDSKAAIFPDKPLKEEQNTPGRAGIDYPTLHVIPETSFSCKTQRYKGFFADPDTKCQVWHYCDLNGGQASFLCPNGTIFNQAALTCDWWFNVKCASTHQLYVLNERLYKYIIPMRPSFPEDYSGPLVDQYLTEKFKETESKRKYRYPTNSTTVKTEPSSNLNMTTIFNNYEIPTHLLNENL